MTEPELRTVRTTNEQGEVFAVVGKLGGVHFHCHRDDQNRLGWDGGVEVHYAYCPPWAGSASANDGCWLLGGKCWHDGSTLIARETYIPLFKQYIQDGDAEPIFDKLRWHYGRLESDAPPEMEVDEQAAEITRLTAEVELSKRVVTAHRRLCDERAEKIKELTAALAEAEAIVYKLDYALNACINQDDFDDLMDKLKEQIAARREKGGAK